LLLKTTTQNPAGMYGHLVSTFHAGEAEALSPSIAIYRLGR